MSATSPIFSCRPLAPQTMIARVAVLGLPVLIVVLATIIGYVNGHPIWAPFAVSVCLIPPVLGLILVLRLVRNKQREKNFTYGQVVWGAIPGPVLMTSAFSLLRTVIYVGLYSRAYLEAYDKVKRDGGNIFALTAQQNRRITAHLMASTTATLAVKEMIMHSFASAFVAETGKLLMGRRVQNLLHNDSIPSVELVIVSFCAPAVGITLEKAVRFCIFTAVRSKPAYYTLFSFLFRFLLRCALDVGTACYMGIAASKRYALRRKETWLPSLAVAILISFVISLAHDVEMEPGALISSFVNNGGNISSRTGRLVYWVTSMRNLEEKAEFCCFAVISILCLTSYIKLRPFMYRRRRSNAIES